jgi:hypothetical protein
MNLEASQERLDNHYTFMRNEWLLGLSRLLTLNAGKVDTSYSSKVG